VFDCRRITGHRPARSWPQTMPRRQSGRTRRWCAKVACSSYQAKSRSIRTAKNYFPCAKHDASPPFMLCCLDVNDGGSDRYLCCERRRSKNQRRESHACSADNVSGVALAQDAATGAAVQQHASQDTAQNQQENDTRCPNVTEVRVVLNTTPL